MLQDKQILYCYPVSRIEGRFITRQTKEQDETKKLTVICDAKAPDIVMPEIDYMISQDTRLVFHAKDDGSGMSQEGVKITVRNLDTGEERRATGNANEAVCEVVVTDSFYTGRIQIIVEAEDAGGNQAVERSTYLIAALEASITRDGAPSEPVFLTGETGKLQILVYGYMEKLMIEYPSEMERGAEEVELERLPKETKVRELDMPL